MNGRIDFNFDGKVLKWKSRVKSGEFFLIDSSLDEAFYHTISAAETLSNSDISFLDRATESSGTLNSMRSMFHKIIDNTILVIAPSQLDLTNAAVLDLKNEVKKSTNIAGKLRIYLYLPLLIFWVSTVYFAYKIFSESFSYDQLMLKLDAEVFKKLESNCSVFLHQLREQFSLSTKLSLKTEESDEKDMTTNHNSELQA